MFWKKLTINMLLVSQLLFILNTIWDFFLTIMLHAARSRIFEILPGMAALIITPWIVMIFILSASLIVSMLSGEKLVVKYDKYGYMVITTIYLVLFVLSLFNPMISWPIMLNYIVNATWAISIIYFKSSIIKGK